MPNVTRDDVISLLQEMKERIASGWTRGAFERISHGTKRYCMTGAINASMQACTLRPMATPLERGFYFTRRGQVRGYARVILMDTMECRATDPCAGVEQHNDACLKKQVEAIDWAERAIAQCKQSPLWD